MLSEYREEPRIPKACFHNKLPKDFNDNVNDTIQDSTALNYCMHRAMLIYHKKRRDTLNILLEEMKSMLSNKEKHDACELEIFFDNNEMCKTRL